MQLIAQVQSFVLDILERFSDEQVLCAPRKSLQAEVKLSPKRLITPNWESLVRLVNREGPVSQDQKRKIRRLDASGSGLRHSPRQQLSDKRQT